MAQRVGRIIALLFHDRGTRRGWVVSSTLRLHFTPGKKPGTRFTEGCVSPRAGLDGRKISSPPGFDPVSSSPRSVAIPTERPGPYHKWVPGIFHGCKGGRRIGLTTLPSSCADCLEIWSLNLLEPSGPAISLCRDCFIFTLSNVGYVLWVIYVACYVRRPIGFTYSEIFMIVIIRKVGYKLVWLQWNLLTYLLHGAESFLRS